MWLSRIQLLPHVAEGIEDQRVTDWLTCRDRGDAAVGGREGSNKKHVEIAKVFCCYQLKNLRMSVCIGEGSTSDGDSYLNILIASFPLPMMDLSIMRKPRGGIRQWMSVHPGERPQL